MSMIFKFDGVDCPNCANLLEGKISKVKGVNECSLNFMTKKLILELENEAILEKIVEICSNFEDGVTLKRIK